MDCGPPGSSVHGILQTRILEWVAVPSSRGSSWPRDGTCFSYNSCIGRWVLDHCHHLGSPNHKLFKVGGEGDDRGWDGWMASPTQWTWVWISSGSWWWTGRPGMLQSMGSQRVGHDWATELNWTESAHPEELSWTRGPLEHTDFVKHPHHSIPEIYWGCCVCAWVRFLKSEHDGQNTCLFQFPVY